jgi:hypothetical protein
VGSGYYCNDTWARRCATWNAPDPVFREKFIVLSTKIIWEMESLNKKYLLAIDAVVNLILGLILLLFPGNILNILGMPYSNASFYSQILGAVLIGIGLALIFEIYSPINKITGLGVGGAIIINTCGAFTLAYLLIFGKLNIPLRGQLLLWVIVFIVFAIGLIEIFYTKGKSSPHN